MNSKVLDQLLRMPKSPTLFRCGVLKEMLQDVSPVLEKRESLNLDVCMYLDFYKDILGILQKHFLKLFKTS